MTCLADLPDEWQWEEIGESLVLFIDGKNRATIAPKNRGSIKVGKPRYLASVLGLEDQDFDTMDEAKTWCEIKLTQL